MPKHDIIVQRNCLLKLMVSLLPILLGFVVPPLHWGKPTYLGLSHRDNSS